MRLKEYHDLFAFNRWANHRVLDVVVGLSEEEFVRDLGSSYPSVRATLAHILSAEWIWLERFRDVSPSGMPEGWSDFSLAALQDQWRTVESGQDSFVMGMSEADVDRVLRYRNTRGEPHAYPLWQALRHVVNHSTYHRGQVITMVRQLGRAAAATDMIYFYAEQTGGG